MHRIDADGHVNNLFVDENVPEGQEATVVDAAIMNAIQEEISNTVEGAGLELEKGNNTQLLEAIKALGVPSGSIFPFTGSSAPTGYLFADGSAISRATYPALWAIAQTNLAADATDFTNNPGKYGRGDGSSTFNLPDLRGKFVRGLDGGANIDTGRALGTYQLDALQNVTGSVGPVQFRNAPAVTGPFTIGANGSAGNDSSGGDVSKTVEFNLSNVARTADETRPKNIAYGFIIKT